MKWLGIVACAIVCAGLFAQAVVQAGVWRVRQNYSDQGGNLTYTNMPDYIEPAAAAANAVFGGTTSNDTWNAWDVDVRNGNMGGVELHPRCANFAVEWWWQRLLDAL